MSDRQSSLWNIRSPGDDDDETTGEDTANRRSSNPFYNPKDDDYEDDYDQYDDYDDEDDEDSAYGSSSRPYGSTSSTYTSSRYGSGESSYSSSSSGSSRYDDKGSSSSGSSAYGNQRSGSSAYGSSSSSSSSSRYGSSGSGYSSTSTDKDDKSANKGSSRFGGFRSGNKDSDSKPASSTGGIGQRMSGGLGALRKRLPGSGDDKGSTASSQSSSNRASTTRTVNRFGSSSTASSASQADTRRKSESKDGGGLLSKISLPFGKGNESSKRGKRQPSTPRGMKRSKPLPASKKRPKIKNEGLSLDLKLDIAGWAMVILSAIIFFGAISTNQGNLSRTLLELIYQFVGVGWFAIPMVLALTGIWLIWRHFGESVPEADYVHIVGWGITYLAAITTFHFVHLIASPVYTIDQLQTLSNQAADLGYGGGWLGGQIYMFLMRNLGDAGAFIALLGWWGIGIIIATDLSFADIILFFGKLRRNIAMRLQVLRNQQVKITPIQPRASAGDALEGLPLGNAGVLESPAKNQRALPAAETMPIPQTEREQPRIRHRGRKRQDAEVIAAPTVQPAANEISEPPAIEPQPQPAPAPAAYVPPTQRGAATQYRMPDRSTLANSPATAPEPVKPVEADTSEAPTEQPPTPEIAQGPVPLKSGEGPTRIRRPNYTHDTEDEHRDNGFEDTLDEADDNVIEVIRPDKPVSAQPVSAEEAETVQVEEIIEPEPSPAIDEDEEPAPVEVVHTTSADDVVEPPADDASPDHDDEDEDEDWMKPAQPRFQGERVLRPLRSSGAGLSPAERAALAGDFADDDTDADTEDAPADDAAVETESDTVVDDIGYEDLPESDSIEDNLDVIEIEEVVAETVAESPDEAEAVSEESPPQEAEASDSDVPAADEQEEESAESVEEPPEPEPEPDPEPEEEPDSLLPSPPKVPEWVRPDYREILDPVAEQNINDDILLDRARIIEDTLASFGAPGKVVEVNPGPVITQFGVEPDYIETRGGKRTRVKVQAIARLADDLALSLAARSIRIEAPVPGKGFVGIEVPNAETSLVSLRDVMESPEYNKIDSTLTIGLGQSVDGTPVAADLTTMPHLLIAGTTGSGKSVCVNAIIACLLMQNTPDSLRFIMVDPKRVELTGYNGIPHLVAPVVVELERIVGVLKWVTREMDDRYRKFNERGARNILSYNGMLEKDEDPLPYLVVVIDELADLMMLAPDETERVLTRLAQMARATGIHLIISTQRPSVDVVTGLIKANFPSRVAFAVASSVDSRVILDQPGAERLLGRGDMLFQAPDAAAPARLQGVYVSDTELNRLVSHWKGIRPIEPEKTRLENTLTSASPTARIGKVKSRKEKYGPPKGASASGSQSGSGGNFWDKVAPAPDTTRTRSSDEVDELYDESVAVVRRLKKASVSLLQRQLRIGYTRAARLIDVMEERGVVGPAQSGSKPRKVIGYTDEDIDLDAGG